MFSVMAADDEWPALQRIGALLRNHPSLDVRGVYPDAAALLEAYRQEPADVVFLDIEMPEMSGLELADRLRLMNEDVYIVFATAYRHYAPEAFDAHAVGYVMKPFQQAHIDKVIDRLCRLEKKRRLPYGQPPAEPAGPAVRIAMFRRFTVSVGESGMLKFRTSKVEELFAYLVEHRGKPATKDQLIEVLWPDREYPKAMTNLYSTVYQLRQTLKPYGLDQAVRQSKSGLRSYWILSDERFACDVVQFQTDAAWLRHEEKAGRGAAAQADNAAATQRLEAALRLYTAAYLEQHDFSWSAPKRAELEREYRYMLEFMVSLYLSRNDYGACANMLEALEQLDIYDERTHRRLLAAYAMQGEEQKAIRLYRRLCETFRTDLGVRPNVDYERIKMSPERYLFSAY